MVKERLTVPNLSKNMKKLKLCILLLRVYPRKPFGKAGHIHTLWPKNYMPTETYVCVHPKEKHIHVH